MENEQTFGFTYTSLFSLIGQHVMTPQGSGTLVAVFARQCEVSLAEKPGFSIRVKPDQIRTMSGKQLVSHEQQAAVDRYMEELERLHEEQRVLAKKRRA